MNNPLDNTLALSRRCWFSSVAATAAQYGITASTSSAQDLRANRNQKQLFLDDHIIHELRGVKKVLNRVKKHPGNPILVPEHPWEFKLHIFWDGASVLYDSERKAFRLWYAVNQNSCYAVSNDG